ncbi:uncharacterized protein F4812DRAFT_457710 [Daldinia caldariorum]|uniref:uncharacterized protein n=1 Tax=Daldinia caldariorum TaxID=326644 RepID=UPI002008A4E3|nr:uncharacterized protein F4812DRAFT_457710 [Daldinia caldariorum]KAI1469167.1 hypothetical protein F4812DRAFT_457710 [Daldinia caldariorum]
MVFKLNDLYDCPYVKKAGHHEAERTSHSHGKKSKRSSQDKDWGDMFLERHGVYRDRPHVVYQHGYGSGARPSRSQDHSYAASHYYDHYGDSGDVGDSQQEPVNPATPVAPAKSLPPAPATPTKRTASKEPPTDSQSVQMDDKPEFTAQPGNRIFVQPVSGGRSVRVREATGYTTNGVAHQAGNFYPPSMNPFASHRPPAGTNQGQASDNDPNQAAHHQADGYGGGLSWGAPDPYGRQYLQYADNKDHKHHGSHHHNRHHRRH